MPSPQRRKMVDKSTGGRMLPRGGVVSMTLGDVLVSAASNSPAPPLTFMAWYTPASTFAEDRHCVFFGTATRYQGAWDNAAAQINKQWFFNNQTVGGFAPFGSPAVGKPDHIAISVSAVGSATGWLYLNGVPIAQMNGVACGGGEIRLFSLSTSSPSFEGAIFDWKCWSRYLGPDEILEEMNSFQPCNLANIHSWLPLDDPNPGIVGKDYSGAGNHFNLPSGKLDGGLVSGPVLYPNYPRRAYYKTNGVLVPNPIFFGAGI